MADAITYVTDTRALIWYLTASPRLGESARQAFGNVAEGKAKLIVPLIVIAELIFVIEHSRAQIELAQVIDLLQRNPSVEIAPLTLEIVLEMQKLTAIAEMHDRLIVCETQMRKAKLITRDRKIRNTQFVEMVW